MTIQSVRRVRPYALLCTLIVLLCELVAKPWAEMGICDDWSYIRTAQRLAETGHIHYNGWATAIIGWQLYLAAAAFRLFGFSFTAARMTILLVALITTFLLQRTLVRAGITEWNASIGTLALVLSQLFLTLSVTFMTDIAGLFAVVVCLYSCLRALQADTDRGVILWVCFAALANAIFGTSRQIAWLGALVLVPSTLWLLRTKRGVLIIGSAATLLGVFFILLSVHWFQLQPYIYPEGLGFSKVNPPELSHMAIECFREFLEIPFFLLPIVVVFFPEVRHSSRRVMAALAAFGLGYVLIAIKWRHTRLDWLLEPTNGDWVGIHGYYEYNVLVGNGPVLLHTGVRIALTLLSVGGLLCLAASVIARRDTASAQDSLAFISRGSLITLLAPFTMLYSALLIMRSAGGLFDRYLLPLLVVVLLVMLRFYQDYIHPRLPSASILAVALVATYSLSCVHNLFTLYRARTFLAQELEAAGIPDTAVDYGWESDGWTELQHADHVDNSHLATPGAVPEPGSCRNGDAPRFPHMVPVYRISFDPDACQGLASFAPVHYSLWLKNQPGTLWVVRLAPPPMR